MSDDMPERIAFRKIFMSQAITSGPLMEHPDYIHYVRADRIEALTEQLAAARQDVKEAEVYADELEEENRLMKTAGIIEVAVRNPSVMEYMKHWEGRVEALEAKLQSSEFSTQKRREP